MIPLTNMIFYLASLLRIRKKFTLNTLRRCWLKTRTISNTDSMEEPPWRKNTTYNLGATGAGRNPYSTDSHWVSSTSLDLLNRSPQLTSVQLGPQPTRNERPMKSAMSISSFPFLWVMDLSRGTSPCCLRTPTVFTCTSGTEGGTVNADASGEAADQRAAEGELPEVLSPLKSCTAVPGRWQMILANFDCSSPPTRRKKREEYLTEWVLIFQLHVSGILKVFQYFVTSHWKYSPWFVMVTHS